MLNYIKSESYRAMRSRGYMLFFGICFIIAIGVNVPMTGNAPYNTTEVSLSIIINLLNLVAALTLCISDMVFGSEYKNQTFKNTLAYGYTRRQIYFGKFITEVIFALAIAIVLFGAYLASAALLLEHSPGLAAMMKVFLLTLLGCVPVWLGCLALGHAILFLVKNGTASGFVFAGLLVLPSSICSFGNLLNPVFGKIGNYILWNQLPMLMNKLYDNPDPSLLVFPTVIGLVQMALFLLVGLVLFEKKEI